MLEIFIFIWKQVEIEGKNQHAVITDASISYGINIPTFYGKSWRCCYTCEMAL